jgi:Bacterial type III secretion protein (HrpB1_HrpK)
MSVCIEPAEFDCLLDVGYLALDHQLFEESERLFSVLCTAQTSNPHPRIALALMSFGQQRVAEAIERLEAVLADFPDAVFTRSLLARFMREVGRAGWQSLANEVLCMASDSIAGDMARELLGLPPEEVAAGRSASTAGRQQWSPHSGLPGG